MCLLIFAWRVHPRYPLIFAGNRDEFHARDAAPMDWWDRPAGLLAGRDLSGGGTWLGLTRSGRFGVVTNFREMGASREGAPSRGGLITALADDRLSMERFARTLEKKAASYAGYNLLFGEPLAPRFDIQSNRNGPGRAVEPGIHGLSNHLLDTPWPKLTRTRRRFEAVAAEGEPCFDTLFAALADREPAADSDLPETGLGYDWEKRLSSPFIVSDTYGTRCTTVLTFSADGEVRVSERRFDPDGSRSGESRFDYVVDRKLGAA